MFSVLIMQYTRERWRDVLMIQYTITRERDVLMRQFTRQREICFDDTVKEET